MFYVKIEVCENNDDGKTHGMRTETREIEAVEDAKQAALDIIANLFPEKTESA